MLPLDPANVSYRPTKYGILLVVDEVQSGMGRTGNMFASDHNGLDGCGVEQVIVELHENHGHRSDPRENASRGRPPQRAQGLTVDRQLPPVAIEIGGELAVGLEVDDGQARARFSNARSMVPSMSVPSGAFQMIGSSWSQRPARSAWRTRSNRGSLSSDVTTSTAGYISSSA